MKNNNKETAINLRKQGKSYNEIVNITGIPKSTLSVWLRNIEIPANIKEKFWNRIREKQALSIIAFNKKQAEKARKNAEYIKNSAIKDINIFSRNELFLMGISLYWAEGYKKNRWTLSFSNSDPLMVKLIMKFFRNICNVPEDKFGVGIQIHPNVTSKEAIKYWSQVSAIPQNKFQKCYCKITPSSKQKRPPNTLPYGTVRISVYDYKLANKMKGWIQGISEKI